MYTLYYHLDFQFDEYYVDSLKFDETQRCRHIHGVGLGLIT
jgi:hypothetical protein